MNKLEMIKALKEETGITRQEAAKVVEIFFDSMCDALTREDRVEIRGLCSFFIKHYPEYTGRNPRSGESVKIAPKKLPFFKAGKALKERINS